MKVNVATAAKSPLWAKILVSIGAVLLVGSGTAFAFGKSLVDKINSIQQENLGVKPDADGKVDGPLNLLMVGADLRVKSDEPSRADTIMILHIDRELNTANVVSIPRDLRVDIPDCGNGQPCTDKINAAYSYGGKKPADSAQNLASTVTELTGVTFDGVAIVNFEGFLDVVKEFGGIELCLEEDLDSTHGDFYKKGCRRYKPDDALAIVRERYAWEDGDYGRQRMQQHFIKQLLKEADSQGYVKNPAKVGGLIDHIGSQLVLDLGGISPTDYATGLRDVKAGKMQNIQLPSSPADIDGTSYVVINDGHEATDSEALFTALKEDTLDEFIDAHPKYRNKEPGHS